jgi:hypothetical protein
MGSTKKSIIGKPAEDHRSVDECPMTSRFFRHINDGHGRMRPSCALADIARTMLSSALSGRRQPESVAKVGSSSTGTCGISASQVPYGIPKARGKPVNRPRTVASFYGQQRPGRVRW